MTTIRNINRFSYRGSAIISPGIQGVEASHLRGGFPYGLSPKGGAPGRFDLSAALLGAAAEINRGKKRLAWRGWCGLATSRPCTSRARPARSARRAQVFSCAIRQEIPPDQPCRPSPSQPQDQLSPSRASCSAGTSPYALTTELATRALPYRSLVLHTLVSLTHGAGGPMPRQMGPIARRMGPNAEMAESLAIEPHTDELPSCENERSPTKGDGCVRGGRARDRVPCVLGAGANVGTDVGAGIATPAKP